MPIICSSSSCVWEICSVAPMWVKQTKGACPTLMAGITIFTKAIPYCTRNRRFQATAIILSLSATKVLRPESSRFKTFLIVPRCAAVFPVRDPSVPFPSPARTFTQATRAALRLRMTLRGPSPTHSPACGARLLSLHAQHARERHREVELVTASRRERDEQHSFSKLLTCQNGPSQ